MLCAHVFICVTNTYVSMSSRLSGLEAQFLQIRVPPVEAPEISMERPESENFQVSYGLNLGKAKAWPGKGRDALETSSAREGLV